jgi:endogenous inhibitor of DNA gyrase (YacG/DUF329 family)
MTRRCPSCERPTDPAYAPFCSKRCADVDLQRWLSGAYAVPGEDAADLDGPAEPPDDGDE